MATGPSLLDTDGSPSIATALLMSHHGLRRDVARFALALERIAGGDRKRAGALTEEWARYRATLHGHHEAEDQNMFPQLAKQDAALGPVLGRLGADHRRIDP